MMRCAGVSRVVILLVLVMLGICVAEKTAGWSCAWRDPARLVGRERGLSLVS